MNLRAIDKHTSDGPKVGVLTFHRCINYGSYWQARCLVEGLRNRGLNAKILDHDSSRIKAFEWRCALHPVPTNSLPSRRLLRYGLKLLKLSHARARLPQSRKFPLDEPSRMEKFDTVVVGSDEVWNLTHPWYGGCRLFFGEGVSAKRLISYAASFGNYDANGGLKKIWTDYLRRFSALSVRDLNSQRIVTSALQASVPLVLDPCLQFPARPRRKVASRPLPFVAVYGHSFSATFVRQVRRVAQSRNLRLLSIGYDNPWADIQQIGASPEEFAWLMANTTCIATNFFHGCIFALKNRKPFVTELSAYRGNKLLGLLKGVGAENHLLSEDSPAGTCERSLGDALDHQVSAHIDALRARSNSYLEQALQ
jgi:Polysaccharide pyruvyl transferase